MYKSILVLNIFSLCECRYFLKHHIYESYRLYSFLELMIFCKLSYFLSHMALCEFSFYLKLFCENSSYLNHKICLYNLPLSWIIWCYVKFRSSLKNVILGFNKRWARSCDLGRFQYNYGRVKMKCKFMPLIKTSCESIQGCDCFCDALNGLDLTAIAEWEDTMAEVYAALNRLAYSYQ